MGKGNEHWGVNDFQPTQHDWDEAQAAEEEFCERAALSIASDLERTELPSLNRFLAKHGLQLLPLAEVN